MLKNSRFGFKRLFIVAAALLGAVTAQAQHYYLQSGNNAIGWADSVDLSQMSPVAGTHSTSGQMTIKLASAGAGLMTWVQGAIHVHSSPNIDLYMYGGNNVEIAHLVVNSPVLKSITFPALGASGPAIFNITVNTGKLDTNPESTKSAPPRNFAWDTKNFSLNLGTLNCKSVMSINAITFNNRADTYIGAPSATITAVVNDASSTDFNNWFNAYTGGKAVTQQGSLTVYNTNKQVEYTMTFTDVMITNFLLGSSGATVTSTATMSVKDLQLK